MPKAIIIFHKCNHPAPNMFVCRSAGAALRGVRIRCTRKVKLLTRVDRGVALSGFSIYLHNGSSPHCFAARTSTARFSNYGKLVHSINNLCRNVVSSTVGIRKACLGIRGQVSSGALINRCVRKRSCNFR